MAATTALAGPLRGVAAAATAPTRRSPRRDYGRLAPVDDARDGVLRLELPRGFRYRSFHHAGATLADGAIVPGFHDGMGAFRGSRRNTTVLVRNHEVLGRPGAFGNASRAYDPTVGGGTITVEVDRHGRVLHEWTSLNGTSTNCNGGVTPWRTWLSGEETVDGPDVAPSPTRPSDLRRHGYLFEVPASGVSDGRPIRSAGRFAHEAAVVDPRTGQIYLTEDNVRCGFYRYTAPTDPRAAARVHDGGVLEALAIDGRPGMDLSGHFPNGAVFATHWVPVADPDPEFGPDTPQATVLGAVFTQAVGQGAAQFAYLEGGVWAGGRVWFVSTGGGAQFPPTPVGRGQVWSYTPATGRLEMFFETPDPEALDLPDNIAVSPSGALVLCEDGFPPNHLRGLTTDGVLFPFARIADPTNTGAEFAGATFSPDQRTLFVNVLSANGYSVAIWGPWERGGFA